MASHFSDKCVFKPSFLIYSVSMWPVCQLSRIHSGGQMHTSISANQLFRVFMIHGGPVGCLIFSRWCLQVEENREAVVTTAGGKLWVPEHFPWLKRKPWCWESPTCECHGKSQSTPQGKYLSVRGNFRLVHLGQERVTTAACKSVMSELSLLLPSTLFQHGLRNEDPEKEREGTLRKWTQLHFLVGPLGLSTGERNIE